MFTVLLVCWFVGLLTVWLLFGCSALMTSTLSRAWHLTCLLGLRFVTSCAATLPMYKSAGPPSFRNTPTMKQPLLAILTPLCYTSAVSSYYKTLCWIILWHSSFARTSKSLCRSSLKRRGQRLHTFCYPGGGNYVKIHTFCYPGGGNYVKMHTFC